jgi:hypothetical protein
VASSEVHRTLVKSPPELWSEVSDAAALGRHLADLGEIRITRLEPESVVEFQTESSTGRIELKATGWGTRVTLRVADIAAEEPPAVLDVPAAEPESEPEAVVEATADEAPDATPEADPPKPVADPFAALLASATAQRLGAADGRVGLPTVTARRPGLIARVLGWRRRPVAPPTPGPSPAEPVEPAAPEAPEASAWAGWAPAPEIAEVPAQQEVAAPAPQTTDPPQLQAESPDLAVELQAAEEAGTEDISAVLTRVLDSLGSAHHRPFSRA